jgi:hypothetical protein
LVGCGSDQLSHQSSGLYVFRPVGIDPPKQVDVRQFYCFKVRLKWLSFNNNWYLINYFFENLKRKGYEEIIQVYSNYVNQSIRLLDNSPYIEFEWVVGRLEPKYKKFNFDNKKINFLDFIVLNLLLRIKAKILLMMESFIQILADDH